MIRTICSAVCLILAALAGAQSTVPITFESSGDHQVWITKGLPQEAPKDATRTKLLSYELPTAGRAETDAVFIWDRQTGNLASKMLRDMKNGWSVKAADYIDIATVKIRVENGGKPVASAVVDLNDGRRSFNDIVSPSSNGQVSFFAVKAGSQKVTVKFKGGDPITQVFSLGLARKDAEPVLGIAIPGKVDTVGDAKRQPDSAVSKSDTGSAPLDQKSEGTTGASGAEKPQTKRNEGGGNFLGSLFGGILGIAIVAGIGWFAVQYYKKNTDVVNAKLTQMGVQIPTPGDDPGAIPSGVIPIAPSAPQPPQKIVLDDSAPTPLSASPIATPFTPSYVSGGAPRLVMESGDAVEIPEGESIVGRELGLWLSLAGESTVSRNHALVTKNGSNIVVRDTGSTNGTYVNSQRLTAEQVLTPGDNVQFGAIKFRYEA